MRIVGGALRGRRLIAPEGRAIRPTADRAREGLFNILEHGAACAEFNIRGATVVDAFAGTGAMGLEALSRGAARTHFLETDVTAIGVLRRNIADLDQGDRAEIVNRDATQPGRAPEPCQLALLDPPYGSALAVPAMSALGAQGWLAPDAVVVAEHGAKEDLAAPSGFTAIDQRRYGAAIFSIFRWHAHE